MAEKKEQELEKGFNDSELADIMSEIETLEKDLEEETDTVSEGEEVASEEEVEESEEMESPSAEDSIEEPVMQDVDDMEVEEVKPQRRSVHQVSENIVPMSSHHGPSAPTSMNFSVEGDMSISLNFNISGQDIKLFVNGQEGLVIELSNGARFSVPIEAPLKKVG